MATAPPATKDRDEPREGTDEVTTTKDAKDSATRDSATRDSAKGSAAARTGTSGRRGLAHRLYVGESSYDFIKNRKRWYIISAVALLVCIIALAVRGLNLGVEFTGGSTFQVPQKTSVSASQLAQDVVDTGLPDMGSTQGVELGNGTIRVQTRALNPTETTQVLNTLAKAEGVQPNQVASQTVGASWGKQITEKGAIALVVFLVLVCLLIWAYFRDPKMAIAALVALLHDLVITVGVYALVGFAVTPATLIAVLTILGYSLYDTVVVFDKVRENVRGLDKSDLTYSQAANLAINQVLIRSLNTTIIGVLPVAAILIAGAFFLPPGPLEDLGLAMLVGMIAGAYSSLFIATPLLAQLREREPAMVAHREALARRSQKHARKHAGRDEVETDTEASARKPRGRTVEVSALDPSTGATLNTGRVQTRHQTRRERKDH